MNPIYQQIGRRCKGRDTIRGKQYYLENMHLQLEKKKKKKALPFWAATQSLEETAEMKENSF